ncbi:unnamed protein product [Brassica napus]|uniref:(rape) hypothetical protein n=1 Tax=Brassica napus TaxID=3708 RepID=A0A816QKX4_BRANA|nr:unnamed protein product [Brassica napus]
MMADAQKKNCPHKIPIKGSYCAPTICLDKCKKQHGTVGSCAEEKGFCNCAFLQTHQTSKKIDSIVSEHDKALKQSMSYNEDVNVKCCACSDPSCTQWNDLYLHAQVTRRNMCAKKLK